MGFCQRCGREAELQSGPDGGQYCRDCAISSRPECLDCHTCAQRYCGSAVVACPFCTHCPQTSVEPFKAQVQRPLLQPTRVEEKCERCGGSLGGRAFVLHGRALCKSCLFHEQDKWEIVTAKPSPSGTRVRIVIEKPKEPIQPERLRDDPRGRTLLRSIGIDPENPPQDPFSGSKPISEQKMPDDSCVNCEAYRMGRKSGKSLGEAGRGEDEK
ncbi:MAG: hypothetical protein V1827_04935 [Candidatus Micrarchaeota archaeon]